MAILVPDGKRFRDWNIDELYFGGVETGEQYRPYVGDKVTDWDVGIFRVTSVDANSIPQLELKLRFQQEASLDIDSDSLLTAISNYQPSAATPIWYDDSVSPAEMAVDSAYPVYLETADKVTFFRGFDTTAATGDVIATDVPLTDVDAAGKIKTPDVFTTTANLSTGDVVTAVIYDSSDNERGKTSFLVVESASVRPVDYSAKILIDISLKSELIDAINPTVIKNDLATPFTTNLVKGYLHYNDGSTVETSIDGSKMVLKGITDFGFNASIKPTQLTLAYYPDSNEPYENAHGGDRAFFSKKYTLANMSRDDTFGLKLYPIPTYVDTATGYTLKWMLTNLDRDVDIDVTDLVNVRREGGVGFTPNDYGEQQVLTTTLDMDLLSPGTYQGFILSQRMTLTIDMPGVNAADAWLMDWSTDGNNVYGGGVYASCGPGTGDIPSGNPNFLLANGTSTVEEWLHKVYHTIEPLYDLDTLTEPVTPTGFKIVYKGVTSAVYPIADFDKEIEKPFAIDVFEDDTTMDVIWIFEGGNGQEVLGHSPMIVKIDLLT